MRRVFLVPQIAPKEERRVLWYASNGLMGKVRYQGKPQRSRYSVASIPVSLRNMSSSDSARSSSRTTPMPRFASPSVTCPAVASSTALMRSHSPSATAPGSAPAAAALSVVRSASYQRARACRSAMLPCQTMRPLLMIPT